MCNLLSKTLRIGLLASLAMVSLMQHDVASAQSGEIGAVCVQDFQPCVPIELAVGANDINTFTDSLVVTHADIDNGSVTNQETATGLAPNQAEVSDLSDDNSNLEDDPTITTLPGDPGIAVIKTGVFQDESGDGFAQVGETILYTFTVTNVGNVTLTDIVINDNLTGSVDLAVTPSTLAPGEVGSAQASYTIVQVDIDQGSVTNQALATGIDPDEGTVTDLSDDDSNFEDDPTVIPWLAPPIILTPDIAVVKTGAFQDESNDGFAQVGETIVYTFLVTNVGETTLTNVVIDDALTGSVNLPVTPSTLNPGEVGTANATYVITQFDLNQGSVSNQALATGTDPEEGTVTDDSDDNSIFEDDPTVVPLSTPPIVIPPIIVPVEIPTLSKTGMAILTMLLLLVVYRIRKQWL